MSAKRAEDRDAELENSTAFIIDKPLSLNGLANDVREELDWTKRKQFSFTAEGDPATASPQNPVTLWFTVDSGDKPDIAAFKRVIAKHDPDAHADPFDALREKAEREEDLTDSEVQLAIRRLLLGNRGM